MDLLDPSRPINVNAPKKFRIYSRNYAQPPSTIAKGSAVRNSFIAEGCVIKGRVENSVISTGCYIEEGAVVTDTVVMPNSVVRRGATVEYAIIGERCTVGENAHVGAPKTDSPEWGVAVVGANLTVGENATVSASAMVEQDVKAGEKV